MLIAGRKTTSNAPNGNKTRSPGRPCQRRSPVRRLAEEAASRRVGYLPISAHTCLSIPGCRSSPGPACSDTAQGGRRSPWHPAPEPSRPGTAGTRGGHPRAPGGDSPGQGDPKAGGKEQGDVFFFPAHTKCLWLVSEKKKKFCSFQDSVSFALTCFIGSVWKRTKGKLVGEGAAAPLRYFCISLRLRPAVLQPRRCKCQTVTMRCLSPSDHEYFTEWRNWGKTQWIVSCHEKPCESSWRQIPSPATVTKPALLPRGERHKESRI